MRSSRGTRGVAVASSLFVSGYGLAQPLVDERVWSEMDRAPHEQHPLVLTVELVRSPMELRAMLPTVEEYNACTSAWLTWEDLVARRESGEQIPEEEIQLALLAAELADSALDAKQDAAYDAYHADYGQVVALSVPPVLARLRTVLGEREVRWPSEHVQFLTIDADEDEFDVLLLEESIKRISYDVEFVPALDQSRLSIRADRVHDGVGFGGPEYGYTGAGVKVAIIDDGYPHPDSSTRLPDIDYVNDYKDYTGATYYFDPDIDLRCAQGHGVEVAGVVFTQPDNDDYVGVAYDATPIAARVWHDAGSTIGCQATNGGWSDMHFDAIQWAVEDRGAHVVNYSLLGADSGDGESTTASATVSLNADWLVYSMGAVFVHSCGNIGQNPYRLAPPSGAYNVLSVGGYEDDNTETRSDDAVWDDTSEGPTQDNRRKPDICAPAHEIITTIKTGGFTSSPGVDGTSFAAPHVAGTVALLLEARPSFTPRQIHAVLLNACDTLPGMSAGWDGDAGWGALDAYRAVQHRSNIKDDSLGENEDKYYYTHPYSAGEEVVFTVAYQREMADAATPEDDSPHDLDLYLEGKLSGGSWSVLASSATGETQNGADTYNNIEQVRYFQAPSGQPQYQFRVRVHRPFGNNLLSEQEFTLAARRPFTSILP